MDPTESSKETFRTAWRQYQETSLKLAALHRKLIETTKSKADLITTTRSNDPVDGVSVSWDSAKAYAAVEAIKALANDYLAVAKALSDQASALEDVTNQATALIQEHA